MAEASTDVFNYLTSNTFMPINLIGGYYSPRSGGTGSTGTLAGSGTQTGSGPYGAVPTSPSPQATQSAALAGNLAQLTRIKQLMAALDEQSARNAQYSMTLNLPNYGAAMGQAMGNIQSGLRGQLPADVISLLQQQAAERGVAGGFPGSPNVDAGYLRALGLTSLDLMQKSREGLTSLMGAVPRGTSVDPSALLVRPEQQQEWQYLANQLKAAPDPAQAAAANLANLQAGMGAGTTAGGGGTGHRMMPSGIYRMSPTGAIIA